jgi:glycosyltransferase involved in cell wall biosynthesis
VPMEKEKEKLISVIVPIYNAAHYLEKCLDSIIDQSYRNLEIILVDDGSDDCSGNLCDRYAVRDDRIRVIHHEKNRGVSAARNSGLDIATGEYLGFADGDDWLESDMYQFMLDDLLTSGADIAVCGFFRTFDKLEVPNDKSHSHQVLERTKALGLLLQDKVLQNYNWCKLYKKYLFDGIRMPEGNIFEDAFTQHLIFEKAQRVVLHNIPKYHYLQRDDSICGFSGRIDGFMSGGYHAALYERVRYFFAKNEKLFSHQAAITYFDALYNSYKLNINSGNEQACAELRHRYASFCGENGYGSLLRPSKKFFYDFIFSDSPGALLISRIYMKCQIAKTVANDEGFRGFYQRVFKKICR